MTRPARLASLYVPLLLAGGCRKSAVDETPATVPIGSVAPSVVASSGESEEPPNGEPKPAAAFSSCDLRATLRKLPRRSSGDQSFSLALENEGSRPVKLTLPGDGSTEGWRTPIVTWHATKNGKEVEKESRGRCGMMNPLRVDEVFTLAPGETKTVEEWIGDLPFPAGTYDVRVTYKNDPSLASGEGKGQARGDDVAKAFASTSSCEVTSNAVRVTIAP